MQEIDPDTHTGQLWTPERILAALGDWLLIHGEPPTGPELKRARAEDPSPCHLKAWPPASAIRKHYPSLDAANAAAQAVQPSYAAQRAAGFRADAQRARKASMKRYRIKQLEDQQGIDRYSDPSALSRMATGPHLDDPAPPTPRSIEPNAGMTFATGRVHDPDVRTVEEDDTPDPYGPEGSLTGEDVYAGAAAILRERYQTRPDGQPSGRIIYEED